MQISKINSSLQFQNYSKSYSTPVFNGKVKVNKEVGKNLLEVGVAAITGVLIANNSSLKNSEDFGNEINRLSEQFGQKSVQDYTNEELIDFHKSFKDYQHKCRKYLKKHKSFEVGAYENGAREYANEIEDTLISNLRYELSEFLDSKITPFSLMNSSREHIYYTDLEPEEMDEIDNQISKFLKNSEYIRENVRPSASINKMLDELEEEKGVIAKVKEFPAREFDDLYREYQMTDDLDSIKRELFNYLMNAHQCEFIEKEA